MTLPRALGVAGLLAVVVLMVWGVYLRIGSDARAVETGAAADSAGSSESSGEAFSTATAIPVSGSPVVSDTLVISVEAAGEAAAWRENVVLAQVAGRLQRLPVRESQRVEGQSLIALIDSIEYSLKVSEAEAQRRTAEAQYRELVLFDDRIQDAEIRAERDRVARAKSGLDGAEVTLQRAQLELARAKVLAPFSGWVADLKVVPGQWINQNDELMTVVDISRIKVEVQVLEREVGYLATGRRATVRFAALPEEPVLARIESINPMVDRQTRTARVTIAIDNRDRKILPGMYARVALEARRFPDRTLVPREAILERDRRTMLFVYESDGPTGLAKWRYVTTGLENNEFVEVVPTRETDPIEPGETVLTDGHYTLVHDARVRLVPNVRAAGGRPN